MRCQYYEKWTAALEILLIEKGDLITPTAAEIDAKAAELPGSGGCGIEIHRKVLRNAVVVNPAFAFVGAQVIPPTISGIADYFRTLTEEETKRQAIAAN